MGPRRFKDLVHWQKTAGPSLSVNGFTLTPQSRVLIVRFPRSAFLWQRPTAMRVERNGQVKELPIVDFTRIIQLGICGLGAVLIIASFVGCSRRKEKAS